MACCIEQSKSLVKFRSIFLILYTIFRVCLREDRSHCIRESVDVSYQELQWSWEPHAGRQILQYSITESSQAPTDRPRGAQKD
jgi:hypothetical protein